MSRIALQQFFSLAIIVSLSSCTVVPVKRITGVAASKESFPPNPLARQGWQLVFSDEFNDSLLDRTKWDTRLYWGGAEPEGRYMPDKPKEYFRDNFFEFTDSSVLLKCDTLPAQIGDQRIPYSCALLDCHKSFEQQYGYFEIRSRNPTGPGFWPAFWLISRHAWPPEIDIYEFYTSHDQKWTNTIHYKDSSGQKMETKAYKVRQPSEGFHIYAVEWNDKEVKWYFDNRLVRTTTAGVGTLTVPLHIVINTAMEDVHKKGTKLHKARFPNYLEVDYVRAYEKTGS